MEARRPSNEAGQAETNENPHMLHQAVQKNQITFPLLQIDSAMVIIFQSTHCWQSSENQVITNEMHGSGERLGCLFYAGLQVGDAKRRGHNRVQALRVVSVHPVASIVQEVDAMPHPGNQVLILHCPRDYQNLACRNWLSHAEGRTSCSPLMSTVLQLQSRTRCRFTVGAN